MHALSEEFQALPSALKKIFRPSIVLRPIPTSESDLNLGQSRMGGTPDLPPDIKWPEYQGKHQVFVAQFAMDDLEGWAQSLGLPATGHLYFFHDQEHSSQMGPKQKRSTLVMYSPSPCEALRRTDFPDDLEDDDHKCPLCKVELHRLQQHAPPWSPVWQSFDSSDREAIKTIREYNTLLFDHLRGVLGWPDGETEPWHVLGGFPTKLVQDSVEFECESYMCDLSEDERWEMSHDEALAFSDQQDIAAQDWVQLLQCDYDSTTGTCWSDVGMLCYLIRKQDLAALAFDRVVAIMQSH